MDNFNFAQQGWQCPICKRVYSPFTTMCYYCGGDCRTTATTSIEIGTDWVEHQKEPSSFTSILTGTAEAGLDCWDNSPTLLTSNPPKLVWKCRYCGKEITTEVAEIPTTICNCLKDTQDNDA